MVNPGRFPSRIYFFIQSGFALFSTACAHCKVISSILAKIFANQDVGLVISD